MLLDYNYSGEKREVQKTVFTQVKKSSLITLAGPNLLTYLNLYPRTVEKVEIWENNRHVMMEQVAHITEIDRLQISYRFGDIINARVDKSAFYDLDFCGTIQSVQHHVNKFRKCAFSATFSMRFYSLKDTLSTFLRCVDEKLETDIPHPQFNLLKTNKNKYLYNVYHGKCAMLFIFKFH